MLPVHEAVVVDGGRTLTRHECSEFEVRAGLRRLQRRFDLRPSGRLDEDTKKLMSRGRCGNSDTDLRKQPETVLRKTGSRKRRRRSVDTVGVYLEPEIVARHTDSGERQRRYSDVRRPEPEMILSQAGNGVRRRRSVDDEDEQPELETTSQNTGSRVRQRRNNTAERPDLQTVLRLATVRSVDSRNATRVPILRRAAEMTSSLGSQSSVGIDHDDLHSRLIAGTGHEPGAALSRRRKMFVEIRKRHRLRIAAEGVPARRNHTDEELEAIRQRIRNGRAQRADDVDDEVPTSPQRRRRRSISVPSFDDQVNEGPATSTGFEERVRFQKNGNSPVRWRLLADGISGKIPLIDQRAILELAFRMWSEVIPLKFHESNSIDVVDVDVIIAFAKRQSSAILLLIRAYFNCKTTATNVPVVLGIVSVVLAFCPDFIICICTTNRPNYCHQMRFRTGKCTKIKDVKVSRPHWSRDHYFGLCLGLTVIGLGLGLGFIR